MVQSGNSEQGPLESHHHMQATSALLQQAVVQPDRQQTNSRLPLLSADGATLPAAGKHMMDMWCYVRWSCVSASDWGSKNSKY